MNSNIVASPNLRSPAVDQHSIRIAAGAPKECDTAASHKATPSQREMTGVTDGELAETNNSPSAHALPYGQKDAASARRKQERVKRILLKKKVGRWRRQGLPHSCPSLFLHESRHNGSRGGGVDDPGSLGMRRRSRVVQRLTGDESSQGPGASTSTQHVRCLHRSCGTHTQSRWSHRPSMPVVAGIDAP